MQESLVTPVGWDKRIASDWEWIGPPARPSLSELLVFDRLLRTLPIYSKVLILGSTVELRDLCYEHRFKTTIVDYDADTFKVLSDHLRHPSVDAQLLVMDWRAMSFSGEFDAIIGDLALNMLPIPDQHDVTKRIAASLKSNGLFIHRTWVRRSRGENGSHSTIADLIAEHKRERPNYNYFHSLAMAFIDLFFSVESESIDYQRLLSGLRDAKRQHLIDDQVLQEFERPWRQYYMHNWIQSSADFEAMLGEHLKHISVETGDDFYSSTCPIYVMNHGNLPS